jgi:hypothetical protein
VLGWKGESLVNPCIERLELGAVNQFEILSGLLGLLSDEIRVLEVRFDVLEKLLETENSEIFQDYIRKLQDLRVRAKRLPRPEPAT